MNPNLSVLRGLISELRNAVSTPLKDTDVYRYIGAQYRRNKITDQQVCRAHEELRFVASAYLCYLRSGRRHQSINEEFHGKGERTVEETAKMVGFKLPHDPK